MSSRVLRRLREEKEAELEQARKQLTAASLTNIDEGISDDDNDDNDIDDDSDYSFLEDEEVEKSKHSKAFLLMMDDSSSSEDDSSSEEDINRDDIDHTNNTHKDDDATAMKEAITRNDDDRHDESNDDDDEDEEEEDLDTILSEFQCQDLRTANDTMDAHDKSSSLLFHSNFLLGGIDSREYDLDFSLRSMLGGGTGGGNVDARGGGGNRRGQQQSSRKTYRKCLFAQPQEDWGRRPPSCVGGGLGMKLLSNSIQLITNSNTDGQVVVDVDNNETKGGVPWPYSEDALYKRQHPEYQAWYSFERSATYSTKIDEYMTHISNTGDINALAMYAADNPFLIEPLLQLAMFFFCTNENERGMQLLKRVLWVLESACVSGFLPLVVVGTPNSMSDDIIQSEQRHRVVINLMDQERDDNVAFFLALFRLVQTSSMMGCIGTSLAAGRLLLSLDPMRDPMGVLMLLDYFALATMKEKDLDFIVDLVELKSVQIYYADPLNDGNNKHVCDLTDMPNWAFAYALALYRQSIAATEENKAQELMEKSHKQLQRSIRAFPEIPNLLLEKNNVDVSGRSFAMDWPSVLKPLRTIAHYDDDLYNEKEGGGDTLEKYKSAINRISQIFVQRGHKLWSGDDVLKWLYDGCAIVISASTTTVSYEAQSERQDSEERKTRRISLALTRYLQFDPSDFGGTFHTLPDDANPLDPALVDPVLHLRPNRRRMLRIPRQLGGGGGGWQERVRRHGGANDDGIIIIDADLPLLEIFWRSFLPWTRVQGVRPNINR